jgi:two-component system sensor histidine kinase/response regulator
MTAHATIEERQRCLAAGMNDHISKPIDPVLLYETVARYYKLTGRTGDQSVPPGGSPDGTRRTSVAQTDTDFASARRTVPVGGSPTGAGASPAPPVDDLPSIAGLDTKDGLSRVAGNRKLYAKLLRQFIEQQGPAVEQITAALAQGDLALAERLAHTLKGVAGNIGAKSVQFAASALEERIRERGQPGAVESAKQQVAAALDPLCAQLQAALSSAASESSAPAPTTASMNPAQSREAAAQLSMLLSEFDSGAADFVETNHTVLRPLFAGETWTQFEKLVQSYSFADAQAQLAEALNSFPPG